MWTRLLGNLFSEKCIIVFLLVFGSVFGRSIGGVEMFQIFDIKRRGNNNVLRTDSLSG